MRLHGRFVAQVLVRTCAGMADTTADEAKFWSKNVNRGVGYHSGWLPQMQRLHIIQKVAKKRLENTTHKKSMTARAQSKVKKILQKDKKRSTRIAGRVASSSVGSPRVAQQ